MADEILQEDGGKIQLEGGGNVLLESDTGQTEGGSGLTGITGITDITSIV